jgi:hypothetical protein
MGGQTDACVGEQMDRMAERRKWEGEQTNEWVDSSIISRINKEECKN